MNKDTKIVFVHYGNSWYLPYVFYQAKSTNENSDVVLLGDAAVQDKIQVVPLENLRNKYGETFRRQYCHMSTNSSEYELFCWLRWFYLLEYMRREHVPSVLHLDSDVLMFSRLEDVRDAYGAELLEGGLMVPEQIDDSFFWVASGHISYWTPDILQEYCEFCVNSFCPGKHLDQYQRKWNWHLSNKKPGGICDMTTLYLFWKERQKRITNLARICNRGTFDLAICTGDNYFKDEYITQSGAKKVVYINQHPAFQRNDGSGNLVRVHAMHFQGTEKQGIRRYYSGVNFKGKTYHEAVMRLRSVKRRLQSIKRRLLAS